jgi:oxygen-independent coproporphyrinogen-3 oxidase
MTWGLYVHVPWCRVRCPYCAFHVDVDDGRIPATAFVDKVLHDLDAHGFGGTPRTLYLGGGTPSRLPVRELRRLVAVVTRDAAEVTVEVNPEDLDADGLAALIDAGVDRVSLGVQSLQPHHARRLGRAHTVEQAHAAMALLAASDLRTWSADLMFGLHAQTLPDLDADLDALLAHEPPHVSLYGLTIEPDTAYERAVARGKLTPPDDDAWRALMERLLERLEGAGLRRYEVSNHARPGHEAVHNRGYWQGRPYLGLGPSAHSLLPDGTRRVEVSDTEAWLAGTPATVEHLTAEQAAIDRLVSGLRGVDGLPLTALSELGFRLQPAAIRQLERADLLRCDPDLRLHGEGFFLADGVTRALVRALEPG